MADSDKDDAAASKKMATSDKDDAAASKKMATSGKGDAAVSKKMATSGGDGATTSAVDVNALSAEELRHRLGELKLSTEGSKVRLAERLRQALAGNSKGVLTDGEEEEELQAEDVDSLPIAELRVRLRALGLKTIGNKATLRERLKAAIEETDESEDEGNDDGDDDDEDEGEEEEQAAKTGTRRNVRRVVDTTRKMSRQETRPIRQTTLSFKDVEDALETFSGDGSENIHRWLINLEETAELCQWTEAQKVIYAKRLLRGSAKLFANFECSSKTWAKLRKSLVSEFSQTVNSKQVHTKLSTVKKRNDESYQAYVYRVLEIASHGSIELEAKIQYIIDGIQDEEANKSILYSATTIGELRKKLAQYEVQKSNTKNKLATKNRLLPDKTKKTSQTGQSADNDKQKRCFNCGSKKHIGSDCPDKEKGPKCFKCGQFGHVAPKCTKAADGSEAAVTTRARVDAVTSGDKKTYKEVSILGKQVTAVIDPGSDLHLVRASLYVTLGAPQLTREIVTFDGVGVSASKTLGRFEADIIIDKLKFTFSFDVIPDHFIAHDLLIGGELSDHAEVRLKHRRATLTEIDPEENRSETDSGWREVLSVNVLDEPDDETEVEVTHVADKNIKTELEELIAGYQPEQKKDSGVKMRIMLTDHLPVYQRARRLSAEHSRIVNDIIQSWIKAGVVRPSSSDYASPVVLVEKGNQEWRLCVDYRSLNKKIIKDRNPLPLIEDQLDRLQDAVVFSTLDLRDGFFHVAVDDDSIKYTSFIVPDGQYEFLKVPFGLCNSPAVFQRHIRAIFRDLTADGTVLSYLDDLIVAAKTKEENLRKLRRVLQVAGEYGLIFNWKKCQFLVTSVDYLGYVIEGGRYRPSDKKTLAVAKCPQPTTVKQIQSFLGLTGYFRKFIADFAVIARPLTKLLKKDTKFVFGPEQEAAFEQLKMALIEKPVLRLYQVGAETELHTDACMQGLGAVLLQRDPNDGLFHPIYYASWKTSPAEEKYTSFELEVLAVIKALKKFRVYLLGIPFKIVTDCKAFASTVKKKDSCLRVSHWILLMEQFQYTIEHRSGTAMRHVDALSRNPVSTLCVQGHQDSLVARIRKAQEEDVELQKIREAARQGENKMFKLAGGEILYHLEEGLDQLVVPRSMQHEVIRLAHERGHFGWKKTEYLLRQEFWFPRMREKIQALINNCIKCLLVEKKKGPAEGLLNPIDKGGRPLDTYHVDHLGPMPSTKKCYNHIFAVVDAFTKFVWLYPTKSTTADEVVNRLRKQAIVFGNPRRLISDRGSAFTSKTFGDYCDEEGIEHVLITTGVPRGNGQVERINRCIIPILSKMSLSNPMEWHKHVDVVQQHLNSSFNRSVGRTPFEVMIGARMRLKDDINLRSLIEKEILEDFENQRSQLRKDARSCLLKIQEENRKTYNRKRKEAQQYKNGDIVAVKRTQLGGGRKLCPKFLGPYKIVSVLRNNRYLVEKIGTHEGPNRTSSAADYMKPWSSGEEDFLGTEDEPESEDLDLEEADRIEGDTELQNGRV